MTFTELIREVWQTGKDRIKNPFLGAFIFSWVAFNYDFLIILFSEYDALVKISLLREASNWLQSFFYPLGMAISLRIVAANVGWLQDYLTQKAGLKRTEYKNEEEKQRLKHQEDTAMLHYNIESKRSGEKTLKDLNDTIDAKNRVIEDLTSQVKAQGELQTKTEAERMEAEKSITKAKVELEVLRGRIEDAGNALVACDMGLDFYTVLVSIVPSQIVITGFTAIQEIIDIQTEAPGKFQKLIQVVTNHYDLPTTEIDELVFRNETGFTFQIDRFQRFFELHSTVKMNETSITVRLSELGRVLYHMIYYPEYDLIPDNFDKSKVADLLKVIESIKA